MEYEGIEEIESAKPCPFCGSGDIFAYYKNTEVGKRYGVICGKCACTVDTGTYQTAGRAITAWNTRKGE